MCQITFFWALLVEEWALYGFPAFSKIMPWNKFQLILRFWNFVDNENSPDPPLSKIMPLVVQLNNKMVTIYTSDRKLSIGESMMLWRGSFIFREYIKNKKRKYGAFHLEKNQIFFLYFLLFIKRIFYLSLLQIEIKHILHVQSY